MRPEPNDRAVTGVVKALTVIEDADMRLLRALPQAGVAAVGPFVFVDHYRHRGLQGIGDEPHPHAGIEVVSYLLDGSAEHRDSMGFRDRLGPGDAQFIRAGRGMLHAEQPLAGRHGLQLWASLPPELKLVEPSYASFRASDMPGTDGPGWKLRVVAGGIDGLDGPMPLSGRALFGHLQAQPGASASLPFDAELEVGLYVMQGEVTVDGITLQTGDLAMTGPGDRIRLSAAGPQTAEVAFMGGEPVRGAVMFSGPFVMDTPERLTQAKRDYASGRMGRLENVA